MVYHICLTRVAFLIAIHLIHFNIDSDLCDLLFIEYNYINYFYVNFITTIPYKKQTKFKDYYIINFSF